jgi:hypothetical protein
MPPGPITPTPLLAFKFNPVIEPERRTRFGDISPMSGAFGLEIRYGSKNRSSHPV